MSLFCTTYSSITWSKVMFCDFVYNFNYVTNHSIEYITLELYTVVQKIIIHLITYINFINDFMETYFFDDRMSATQLFNIYNMFSVILLLCYTTGIQPLRSTRSSSLVTLLHPTSASHACFEIRNCSFRHAATQLWNKQNKTDKVPHSLSRCICSTPHCSLLSSLHRI